MVYEFQWVCLSALSRCPHKQVTQIAFKRAFKEIKSLHEQCEDVY